MPLDRAAGVGDDGGQRAGHAGRARAKQLLRASLDDSRRGVIVGSGGGDGIDYVIALDGAAVKMIAQ